jgi:serine/threonine protein kinase
MGRPGDDSGVFSVPDAVLPPLDHARTIAGRYEIVERLGSGAMGQVVHVRHVSLGKDFAIKLMHPDLVLDPEARERFVSEARLASMLSHPNIVSVLDFGDDPEWGLFLVMELLKGERLTERIERGGRLSVEIVCRVARQLAMALHHSHKTGVVHGDVKPDNVLCVTTERGDGWDVRLLDFGTARVPLPLAGREAEITGTPAYLAPERALGHPTAPSNDLYAFGVILYELLAGSPPFAGLSAQATVEAHVHAQPEPVGARRGEVLDDALVAIVDRCLAKDPAQRYASAQAIVNELDAYLHAIGVREQALADRIRPHTREQTAADVFDALAVAAAGVADDGTIRVANAAFARLLGLASAADAEGNNLLATQLSDWHPGVREDLRLVAMRGKLVRRHVSARLPDGTEVALSLTMSPSAGRGGACVLTLETRPDA